jgi:hypothetical protein
MKRQIAAVAVAYNSNMRVIGDFSYIFRRSYVVSPAKILTMILRIKLQICFVIAFYDVRYPIVSSAADKYLVDVLHQ